MEEIDYPRLARVFVFVGLYLGFCIMFASIISEIVYWIIHVYFDYSSYIVANIFSKSAYAFTFAGLIWILMSKNDSKRNTQG